MLTMTRREKEDHEDNRKQRGNIVTGVRTRYDHHHQPRRAREWGTSTEYWPTSR
jgi:hypothetical protein